MHHSQEPSGGAPAVAAPACGATVASARLAPTSANGGALGVLEGRAMGAVQIVWAGTSTDGDRCSRCWKNMPGQLGLHAAPPFVTLAQMFTAQQHFQLAIAGGGS